MSAADLYRQIVDQSREGVWVLDADGCTVFANAAMCTMLRTPDLIGRSLYDFVDDSMQGAVRPEVEGSFEIRLRRADGTGLWARISSSPRFDDDGNAAGVIGFVSDVTERKQIEETLRRRDAEMTIAQQLAKMGSWELDFASGLMSGSTQFWSILGMEPPPSFRDDPKRFLAQADLDRLLGAVGYGNGSIIDLECPMRREDGVAIIAHIRAQVIADAGGAPSRLRGMAKDITERVTAVRALRKSEQRYRELVLRLPGIVWQFDDANGFTCVGPQVEALTGFTAGQFNQARWSERIHPDDRERVARERERAFRAGGEFLVEYRFERRDGTWVWMQNLASWECRDGHHKGFGILTDITAQKEREMARIEAERKCRAIVEQANDIIFCVDASGCIATLSPAFERIVGRPAAEWIGRDYQELATVAGGEDFARIVRGASVPDETCRGELEIVTASGARVLLEITVRRVEGGETIGIARDITERREMEMELERDKRLASLGQLAASVAHEFNNVLMGILTFAEVLRRQVSDERVADATEHITESVRRGRNVCREILRFSRPAKPVLAPVEPAQWATNFAGDARALLGARYAIRVNADGARGRFVMADRALLDQVATNIILNARDAMSEGGTITIAVAPVEGEIEIHISDTGTGIQPEHLDRVFDPLFSTKRLGTGLGLSIAYQAMQLQGGSLRAHSKVGTGSTFAMVLRQTHSGRTATTAAAPPRRIAIMEDGASRLTPSCQ